MQSISNNIRTLLRQGAPVTTSLTITEASPGTQIINILPDDLMLDGVTIRRSCCSGKDFTLGGAEASELVATIINEGGKFDGFTFEGATVDVLIHVGAESFKSGTFIIDERPAHGGLLQIKAFDSIARFMRDYDTTLMYPATVNQILRDACTKCGVTLDSATIPNGSFQIKSKPEDATYQEVVRWCAEIAGGFAYCDETGALNVRAFGANAVETIDNHYSMKRAEKPVTITGISCDSGDDTYLAGTETYTVDVSGNQLLSDNPAGGVLVINEKVNGLTWHPVTELQTVPFPYLWPGDAVDVEEDGKLYKLLITDHACNVTKESSIISTGEPEIIKGYATAAPLTAAQKRTITTISRNITRTKTEALEQETLNLFNTLTGALGFYPTTFKTEDGRQIIYAHDQPTLEESMIIYTMTEQGWASTTTGWNDGSPAWTYGVTFDGSMVMRVISTVGLNAEWIHLSDGSNIEDAIEDIELTPGPPGEKGEDAITVHIDSINGNIFKNSSIATTLVVTVIAGNSWIDTSEKLKDKFGETSHLKWSEKRFGELEYIEISREDSRISDDGFIFTVSAADVMTKSTFRCDFII